MRVRDVADAPILPRANLALPELPQADPRGMSESLDESAATVARDFADALAAHWQTALAPELIGVYLIGSLAHGGFSRRYSDIDVAVITEKGLLPSSLERMRARAASVSEELAPKLSIFWTDRSFSVGRFPPLDRADYIDHAVTVIERDRVAPTRPALNEVRSYLAAGPLTNWATAAEAFAARDALDPKDRKSYLRALLYPARFVLSWTTGRMASNDDAVAYLARHAPDGLDVALIRRALACRQSAADPDLLFPERTLLPLHVAACKVLVAGTQASG